MAELKKSVLLRLDPEFLARVDVARGEVARHRWIVGRLEEALGPEPTRARDGSSSASPRASRRTVEEDARIERDLMAVAVEGGGSGGPPPSVNEPLAASPIVPPAKDGECPYSPAQLAGMAKVPVAAAKRAIEDGSWRRLL